MAPYPLFVPGPQIKKLLLSFLPNYLQFNFHLNPKLDCRFFCCSVPPPPLVMWAQRPTLVFLTFCLEDCKEPEIKVDADKLHFKGVGGTEKKVHEVTIHFFKEIDPEVTANLNQFHLGSM